MAKSALIKTGLDQTPREVVTGNALLVWNHLKSVWGQGESFVTATNETGSVFRFTRDGHFPSFQDWWNYGI